jgi:hypothetical protein
MAKSAKERRRTWSDPKAPKKREGYYGSAHYDRVSPELDVPSMNVVLPFEEAIKLSLALQAALLELNQYSRSGVGKDMGVLLSLKGPGKLIHVMQRRVSSKDET